MTTTSSNDDRPALPLTVFEIRIRNHPGALAHLVGLFSRRACNIEELICVPSPCGSTSRIRISTRPIERPAQMARFVGNLDDVTAVRVVAPDGPVSTGRFERRSGGRPADTATPAATAADSWRYDEFAQVGRDYGLPEEVLVYDESHALFRDRRAESVAILDALRVRPEHRVVDLGCGTGVFPIHAAESCAHVYGVDVSDAMLAHAKALAVAAGADNVSFHHGGFLTYEHGGEPVDAVVSTFALHHLPDFWKHVALGRIRAMLKPGGVFFLRDVVLEAREPMKKISSFIEHQSAIGGDLLREDAEGHFRDEFSTFDWVMEGMLSRCGFEIDDRRMEQGVIATYRCTKSP